MNGFYKFAIGVMKLVMPLWYRIDADGLENLPEDGGYLFVSNHRSMADPILIGIQNPQTQFCFLAKQELFESGFVGWLLKKLGAIAIDRGTGDTDPLEEMEFRLQNGQNALIFPEGTRSKDGKLGKFKTGAALIAAQSGAPVVPVGIYFDDDELHFRSTIHIRYGEPFKIPKTDGRNPSPTILKQVRQQMTQNVSALLTMDDDFDKKQDVIAMKQTANSDEEKPENIRTKQSSDENLESEGKENTMSKENQNEKNRADKPEVEKDILKEIEDEISEEIEEIAEEVETADTKKKPSKKVVEDASDAIDELDEKEEKAAKRAASAMKASDSFKKRIKDTEPEEEIFLDEDDFFEDEKKSSKKEEKSKQKDSDEEKFFEEEDFDEDFDLDEKPGLFSGFSLKNPFKKKSKDDFDDFDDDFNEDIDENDDYDDDDYEDDYEEGAGKRIDYGKIALILTFVILGIFAVDFAVRLYNDYKNTQGQLELTNQASKVDSMADSSGVDDVASTTSTSATLATEVTTTLLSETTTTTTTTEAFADDRATQTIEVANDTMHSGSLILLDGAHQMTAVPSLVTFASFSPQHLRLVSTEMTVDASLAMPITNWFKDFFAATGLGNVMVYNTTGTPGYAPYSTAIPERASGLTLDLAILNEAAKSHSPYAPDGNYAWLTEHAAEYGFIVRYPADKADKTGHDAMPWHFRYVGVPHAKYMYDNNLCLEEYLEEIKNHTVGTEHLETTVNGVNYEMYYVTAGTGTTTEVKYPLAPDGSTPMISGDNVGGFIVAAVK